jgi:hypothetical protein
MDFPFPFGFVDLPNRVHIVAVAAPGQALSQFAAQGSCARKVFTSLKVITVKLVDMGCTSDERLNDGHAQFRVIGSSLDNYLALQFLMSGELPPVYVTRSEIIAEDRSKERSHCGYHER